MRFHLLGIFILIAASSLAGGQVSTALPTTAPAGIDAPLWRQMQSIDAAAARVQDLSADFEQRKLTPLLKQPMISTGQVLAKGDHTLWLTRSPQPTQMAVDPQQVTIFYPQQHSAEIYPLSGVLAQLTASPIPRLSRLLQQFNIAPAAPATLGSQATAASPDQVAFNLTPIATDLREHVQQVGVLIDARRGLILLLKLVDGDDETTELRFSNLTTNTGLSDDRLILQLPPGTNVTHPLENLGNALP